jgi:hypothetical protein
MIFLHVLARKLRTKVSVPIGTPIPTNPSGQKEARATSAVRCVSQQQEAAPLSLPQLKRLFEVSFVRDERSASNADVVVIPSHHRVIHQILSHWQPFLDLKLMFAGSRRAEQLSLRSQQHIVATVEDSVLRTEMAGLESQEEDAPKQQVTKIVGTLR